MCAWNASTVAGRPPSSGSSRAAGASSTGWNPHSGVQGSRAAARSLGQQLGPEAHAERRSPAPQRLGQDRPDGVEGRVVVRRIRQPGQRDDRGVPVELHVLATRSAHVELRARREQSGLEQAEALVVVVLEDEDAHVRSMDPARGACHSDTGGEP